MPDYKAMHARLMNDPAARRAGMASLRAKLFAAHTRFANDPKQPKAVRADQQNRADFIKAQQIAKGEV